VSPIPPRIEELAAACVDYVGRALGFGLDFAPETLSVVDHYLADVRRGLADNPALGTLVAPAVGAYFGQVVVSHANAFWHVPSDNLHDWLVCCRSAYLCLNPAGVGYDALHGGEAHDGPRSDLRVAPGDRVFVDGRLSALPPLPEGEYFLLTTRFEVIEVVLDSLHARMNEEGYGGTEYGPEDYGFG
jgi:hypothetical protein